MIRVDKPLKTQALAVDEPSPNVDNHPANVDERALIVDSRFHNILWLISGTER